MVSAISPNWHWKRKKVLELYVLKDFQSRLLGCKTSYAVVYTRRVHFFPWILSSDFCLHYAEAALAYQGFFLPQFLTMLKMQSKHIMPK